MGLHALHVNVCLSQISAASKQSQREKKTSPSLNSSEHSAVRFAAAEVAFNTAPVPVLTRGTVSLRGTFFSSVEQTHLAALSTSAARSARTCRPSRPRCSVLASKSQTGMQPGRKKEPSMSSTSGTTPAMPACACARWDGTTQTTRGLGGCCSAAPVLRAGLTSAALPSQRTLSRGSAAAAVVWAPPLPCQPRRSDPCTAPQLLALRLQHDRLPCCRDTPTPSCLRSPQEAPRPLRSPSRPQESLLMWRSTAGRNINAATATAGNRDKGF